MGNLIRKYKVDSAIWAGLVLTYFVTRLVNLGLIPIFTDEAIYLRWSQIMAYDASLRYLPLVDGKPPLFMWLTSTVMRLLPQLDLLLTGRLISVAAGLGSLVGIYFLALVLFKKKPIAWFSALLYLFIPFTLFYDRFGLADSLLTMWGIWALFLAILLVKTLRLDVALIFGAALGFGLLTKSPATLFYSFIPLSLMLRVKNFWKWLGLVFLTVAISQMFFSVLRLFPLFNMIAQKNAEFLGHPFANFFSNASSLLRWETAYLTWPIALLSILAVIWAFIRRCLPAFLLILVVASQFLAIAIFNSSIFPRYLLPITSPILVLASWGFWQIRRGQLVAIIILLLFPLFVDFQLWTNPPNALIADGDSNQYLNAWPAGYGVAEIRQFLKEQSKKYPKVTVGTEGTFGLMPYSLELYQKDYPRVEIKDYWPLPDRVPTELSRSAKDHPTYFIIYQRQSFPLGWKLEPVKSYQQGKSKDSLRLYRVLPES